MNKFKSSFSSPQTKKTILTIFSLALLICVLPLIVVTIKWRKELRKAAIGELTDTAVLSFSPSATQIDVGGSTTVEIRLNTGGQDVYAVDMVVGFDSNFLSLTGIVPNTTTNFKTFVPWEEGTEEFAGLNQSFLNQANVSGEVEFGAVDYFS